MLVVGALPATPQQQQQQLGISGQAATHVVSWRSSGVTGGEQASFPPCCCGPGRALSMGEDERRAGRTDPSRAAQAIAARRGGWARRRPPLTLLLRAGAG